MTSYSSNRRSRAPVLVCFDVGGVLVRLCSAWDEACLAAGLDVRRSSAGPAVAARRRELVMLFDAGRISLHEWAEGVARAIDAIYSVDELKRILGALFKSEYTGARELVERVEAAGIATACLSNTNASHWLRLSHTEDERPRPGLPEFPSVARLKHRVASHVLGVVKPRPEIYPSSSAPPERRHPRSYFSTTSRRTSSLNGNAGGVRSASTPAAIRSRTRAVTSRRWGCCERTMSAARRSAELSCASARMERCREAAELVAARR